jgi:uncharacterized surface protein with fasciclin (FAS1) repeats
VADSTPSPNGAPVTSSVPVPSANGSPKAKRSADRAIGAHDHDIVTTAAGSGRLKIFVDLVRAAGLTELLRGTGPFTVFAPTDRAFDRMPERELDALRADTSRLAAILGHHVVPGRVKAPKQHTPQTATPITGANLTLTSSVDEYHVNEARLVRTNIRASNGVIHAINKLLIL